MRARSLVGILLFVASPSLAWDAPDSQLDTATGLIHTLDSVPSGSDQVIRHTVDPGVGQPTVTEITSGHADHSPHLAIDGAGVLHAVWQRDLAADQIRAVAVDRNGTAGTERLLSDTGEDSRNPDIALFGSLPCVAYEIHGGAAVTLAVQTILDDPDPIGPRIVVGTTSFTGDADLRIHTAEGHLWVTWMDAENSLGFSVHDAGTESWTSPQLREVVDGDVAAARKDLQGALLSP
jgi:hypothetical protein